MPEGGPRGGRAMGEKRVVAFASIVYTRTLHYYNNYTALITPKAYICTFGKFHKHNDSRIYPLFHGGASEGNFE